MAVGLVTAEALQVKDRGSEHAERGDLGWAGDREGGVGAGTRVDSTRR